MSAREAGDLVKRYKDQLGHSQTLIAHELSQATGRHIDQSTVSKHMRGVGWTFDLPPAYVKVLGIPADEMGAAWGLPLPSKAPRPASMADVIKADPTLSPAAKKHLLNQYDLLQKLSCLERRGKPVPTQEAAKRSRSVTSSRRSPRSTAG